MYLGTTYKIENFDLRSKTIFGKGGDRLERKSLKHWTLKILKKKKDY